MEHETERGTGKRGKNWPGENLATFLKGQTFPWIYSPVQTPPSPLYQGHGDVVTAWKKCHSWGFWHAQGQGSGETREQDNHNNTTHPVVEGIVQTPERLTREF
uniref:Uncharacterized protein n=1 Tax=Eutreptiella gymnastica TaxID=73025 RepID=A0A7S1IJE6_9EUGL